MKTYNEMDDEIVKLLDMEGIAATRVEEEIKQ